LRKLADGGLVAALTATSPARLGHPEGGPPLTGTNPLAIAIPSSDGKRSSRTSRWARVTYGDVLAGAATNGPARPLLRRAGAQGFALAVGLQLLVGLVDRGRAFRCGGLGPYAAARGRSGPRSTSPCRREPDCPVMARKLQGRRESRRKSVSATAFSLNRSSASHALPQVLQGRLPAAPGGSQRRRGCRGTGVTGPLVQELLVRLGRTLS
jgi:hypothetical protein